LRELTVIELRERERERVESLDRAKIDLVKAELPL